MASADCASALDVIDDLQHMLVMFHFFFAVRSFASSFSLFLSLVDFIDKTKTKTK